MRKYELEHMIGRGGMAEVHRARMLGPGGFEKIVCLKRILPEHSSNPGFEAMFMDEARVAAALHHANIVQVFDFFRDDDGRLTIVMEYVEGVSLRRLVTWLSGRGEVAPPAVVALAARSILEALHHAWHGLHDGIPLRVIHRDVSPHNILLGTSGEVKLADFGIAKALITNVRTRVGVVKGKASYMSPEQAAGGKLDCRSDLYSAGVVLWELTTGRRLFPAGGRDGMPEEPPWEREAPSLASAVPDVQPGLARLIDALLARGRDDRPSDPGRALALLEESGIVPASSMTLARLVIEAAGPAPVQRAAGTAVVTAKDPARTGGAEPVEEKSSEEASAGSPPVPLDSGDILTERAIPPAPPTLDPTAALEQTAAARTERDGPAVRRRKVGPLAWGSVAFVLASLVAICFWAAPGGHGGHLGTPREEGLRGAGDGSPGSPDEAGRTASPARANAPERAAGEVATPTAPGGTGPEAQQEIVGPAVAGTGVPTRKATAAAGTGTIDVNAKPWAEVWLDGRKVGSTPARITGVSAGKHVVKLVNDSIGTQKGIPVKICAGATVKVAADMTAPDD